VRYLPQRARKTLDLATLLKVCPQCLGDLVARSDFSGDYYLCLQCNLRTEPMSRIGRLPDFQQTGVSLADESLPRTAA
jgi:hypothetical protein